MIKLKNGDKVKIISQGFNDYYAGGAFRIRDEMNNRYSLEESNAGYYFTLKDFKYIQPQTLTIEMASDPDVVVNCRTGEDAKYFCTWLDLHRKRWYDNGSYTKENNWGVYHHETCYDPKNGTYCRQDYFRQFHKIIVRFTPTMIQNDPIWAKHEAYNALAHSSKLPNENRGLCDVDATILHKKLSDVEKIKINLKNVFITNIDFSNDETTVEFNQNEKIKVICQDSDTYSKEQAITQAIAKYCGYGTKRINDLIEKFDVEEEEFKPYLINFANGKLVGYIGTETSMRDALGRKLFVGDVVNIYVNGNFKRQSVVVDKSESGSRIELYDSCKMLLIKPRNSIPNGYIKNNVQYIKSPPKSNIK